MKVAVLQSNYIPWKGYFDLIHDVDRFVFYDDVQYTKNDWRNRNKIKVPTGTTWLTIPVGYDLQRKIYEVKMKNQEWQKKHWDTIRQVYAKAPCFKLYQEFFESVYLETQWDYLWELNHYLIRKISQDFLQIKAEFCDSRDFELEGKKQERLLDLLRQAGATTYISGPAAKNYIDSAEFSNYNIELIYKNYQGYPEYQQFYPPFEQAVSILDLLFHTGTEAPYYIWGWRNHRDS